MCSPSKNFWIVKKSSASNKIDSKERDKIIKEINASIASGEFYQDQDDEITDEEYIEDAVEFGYFQEDEDFDDDEFFD